MPRKHQNVLHAAPGTRTVYRCANNLCGDRVCGVDLCSLREVRFWYVYFRQSVHQLFSLQIRCLLMYSNPVSTKWLPARRRGVFYRHARTVRSSEKRIQVHHLRVLCVPQLKCCLDSNLAVSENKAESHVRCCKAPVQGHEVSAQDGHWVVRPLLMVLPYLRLSLPSCPRQPHATHRHLTLSSDS